MTFREGDFGAARWIWADDKNFGFASGKGDPRQLREGVRRLRAAFASADDDDDRARLLGRLGRLNGGLATVFVGGIAEDEIRGRKELAERTVRALRERHQRWRDTRRRDRAAALPRPTAGRRRSARRIGEPRRPSNHGDGGRSADSTMLANAGYEPSEVLARLGQDGAEFGFDVMADAIVDVAEAGILDVAQVQLEALQRAVSSAALALTIDVLVLHREPETMTDP